MLWAPDDWGMCTAMIPTPNIYTTHMLETLKYLLFYPRPSAHLSFSLSFFHFLAAIFCIFPSTVCFLFGFTVSSASAQTHACCVVGLSGERGPDPENRGGVGRLLTPGDQTAANGEQVWHREAAAKGDARRGGRMDGWIKDDAQMGGYLQK